MEGDRCRASWMCWASLSPDVVALQEVEVGRVRTGRVDQPRVIADRLGMRLFFTSALHWHDGKYGIAILSRLPLALVQAGRLPRLSLPVMQPRVAMAVSVATSWGALVVVNTHLGLVARERRRQVEELLGPRWLGGGTGESPWRCCAGTSTPCPPRWNARGCAAAWPKACGRGRRQATFPSRWPSPALGSCAARRRTGVHVQHRGALPPRPSRIGSSSGGL